MKRMRAMRKRGSLYDTRCLSSDDWIFNAVTISIL